MKPLTQDQGCRNAAGYDAANDMLTPMPPLPTIKPGTAIQQAIGAASAQTAPIQSSIVRLVSTSDCHIVFGQNPTATATDTLLLANQVEYFSFTKGDCIAVVQDSAAGYLYITPAQ